MYSSPPWCALTPSDHTRTLFASIYPGVSCTLAEALNGQKVHSYIQVLSSTVKDDLQKEALDIAAHAFGVAKEKSADPEQLDIEQEREKNIKEPYCIKKHCQNLTEHPHFQKGVMVLVLANVILMATDHHNRSDEYVTLVLVLEAVFTAVYIFEAFVKINATGFLPYNVVLFLHCSISDPVRLL